MPSDSSVVRAAMALVIASILAALFLTGGAAGVLSAFSSFSVSTGVLIVLVLFFIEGGHEKVGLGVSIASILVIGGLIMGSSAGLASIASLVIVVSAVLILIYGFTEANVDKDNPTKHFPLIVISAAVIVFVGSGVISQEFSLATSGIILFFVVASGLSVVLSKLSEEDSILLWTMFVVILAVAGGLALMFAGVPGLIAFVLLVLVSAGVFIAFPDVASAESAINSWIGMGSAVLIVFFLAAMQGILPGILRSFSLFIMLAGLVTIALFLRISDREIPGTTATGLMVGTILTLVGLYMVLF